MLTYFQNKWVWICFDLRTSSVFFFFEVKGALRDTTLARYFSFFTRTFGKFTASWCAFGAVWWRPQRIARPRRPRWLAPPTPLATGIIYKSMQTGGRRILHDSVVCQLMTAPGRAGNRVRVRAEPSGFVFCLLSYLRFTSSDYCEEIIEFFREQMFKMRIISMVRLASIIIMMLCFQGVMGHT